MTPPLSKKKQILFRVFLIFAPFFLLFFLEGILRLGGLFRPESLFIREDAHLRLNTRVALRYFNPGDYFVPELYSEKMALAKPADTFRIFCLGGSSTAGFPFDAQVPFPHQLKLLLSENDPRSRYECINVGLSAVNSFTVLDLLPEVLKADPDLIILYMGHNEFYGAYGSCSAISLGKSGAWVRFYLKLQKMRIVQMMKRLVGLFGSDQRPDPDATLMEKMAAEKSVSFESAVYYRTLMNFRENLSHILRRCEKRDVPVIVSSLAANLKDQAPLMRENNRAAHELFDAAEAERDTAEAYRLFSKARDFDALRFRAPAEMNRIIQAAALQHNARFVDMERVFRDASDTGVPGDDLFCDHLHPHPDGYFLMARTFYGAIADLFHHKEWPPVVRKSALYVTDLDWNIGLVQIYKLKHRWPFEEQPVDYSRFSPYGSSPAGQAAMDYLFNHGNWFRAHESMADHYMKSGDEESAVAELKAILSYVPEYAPARKRLARYYFDRGRYELSDKHYTRLLEMSRQPAGIYFNLAISQWRLGKLQKAIGSMIAVVNAPDVKKEQKLNALFYLAGFYKQAAQYDRAVSTLESILTLEPQHRPARQFLGQIRRARMGKAE